MSHDRMCSFLYRYFIRHGLEHGTTGVNGMNAHGHVMAEYPPVRDCAMGTGVMVTALSTNCVMFRYS